MNRIEFERVSPETVGIPSAAIEHLLDKLESGFTEPHGLMIMRHGKICAEGWWSPFAPGIRHGLQSHTKTYAATAVGIAYTEGLLKLDDKIIDIFKEEAPAEPSENLKKLTVHDVLCMGCGMDEMPEPSENWIRDFLAIPVNHIPGTQFMYNSTGSTLLGAIVKRLTGQGLHEYLKPRLFEKIGIAADNLRWMCMPDGIEAGGFGLYATTEDNLRLMKLYADGGVWNGERILAEDFVATATSIQIDSSTEELNNPPAKDNFVGYGYQIWMCRPEGVYRADGAMGQFTIVFPDKDMLISITENASGAHWAQKTLDVMWEFLKEINDNEELNEDVNESYRLANRLKCLALPNPLFAPFSSKIEEINNVEYFVKDSSFSFENPNVFAMTWLKPSSGISSFSFNFNNDICIFSYTQDGQRKQLEAAVDGTRHFNRMASESSVNSIALANGAWTTEDTFELIVRWLETCFEYKIYFTFSGESVSVTSNVVNPFQPHTEGNGQMINVAMQIAELRIKS